MKLVRWVGAHVDSPPARAQIRATFWSTVTGYTLGNDGSLTPSDGDAYLTCRDTHLPQSIIPEFYASNVQQLIKQGSRGGGKLMEAYDDSALMMSPAGLLWLASKWTGQRKVPAAGTFTPPQLRGETVSCRVDQIVVNVPSQTFDDEAEYWSALLGWRMYDSAMPNFLMLVGRGMPLRLVLQRMKFAADEPGIYLEIACGPAANMERTLVWHKAMGATPGERHGWWVAMTSPAGAHYGLTRRDVKTGAILR